MKQKEHSIKTSPSTLLVFLRGFTLGIVALSSFYYLLLLAVTWDPQHPITQFSQLQPWMSLLIIGFGVQLGLYNLMRKGIHFSLTEKRDANMAAGAGASVSGIAMVACCAHHIVDILPLVGLSAAALFLSEYQEQFIILGIVSNIIGVSMMLWYITGKVKPRIIVGLATTRIKNAL